MTSPKVGDVVAWADVPDGAMVRTPGGRYAIRRDRLGTFVHVPGDHCDAWGIDDFGWWGWSALADTQPSTIVALHLTGQETADDLRRLAEVFEVREAWENMPAHRGEPNPAEAAYVEALSGTPAEDAFFERLCAAGWRPGMTAEDAARLLAAARD